MKKTNEELKAGGKQISVSTLLKKVSIGIVGLRNSIFSNSSNSEIIYGNVSKWIDSGWGLIKIFFC